MLTPGTRSHQLFAAAGARARALPGCGVVCVAALPPFLHIHSRRGTILPFHSGPTCIEVGIGVRPTIAGSACGLHGVDKNAWWILGGW